MAFFSLSFAFMRRFSCHLYRHLSKALAALKKRFSFFLYYNCKKKKTEEGKKLKTFLLTRRIYSRKVIDTGGREVRYLLNNKWIEPPSDESIYRILFIANVSAKSFTLSLFFLSHTRFESNFHLHGSGFSFQRGSRKKDFPWRILSEKAEKKFRFYCSSTLSIDWFKGFSV